MPKPRPDGLPVKGAGMVVDSDGRRVVWSSGTSLRHAPVMDEVVAWDKCQSMGADDVDADGADAIESTHPLLSMLPSGDDPLVISRNLGSVYWLHNQGLCAAPLSRQGRALWAEMVEPELERVDVQVRAELRHVAAVLTAQREWERLPHFYGLYYRSRACTQCVDGLVGVRPEPFDPSWGTDTDTCGCVRNLEELLDAGKTPGPTRT